jgi:hypothetical protein
VIWLVVKVELKYEENFKSFLCSKFDNQRVISDCISRCKRVQKYEGNLADHFRRDSGKSLSERLDYSIQDVDHNKHPKHSIPIKGSKGLKSIYEGTKSLETDIRHYFEFMRQQ